MTYHSHPPRTFAGENGVQAAIDFLRTSVTQNGDPAFAGLEEEIMLLRTRDGTPPSVAELESIVIAVTERLSGQTKSIRFDDGRTYALAADLPIGSINVETNTTIIEFAHKPWTNAHHIARQSELFVRALSRAAHDRGFTPIGMGFVPSMGAQDFTRGGRHHDAVVRFEAFQYSLHHIDNGTRPEYLKTVFGTASTHHNLGFNDPERMAKFFAVAMHMQPTMVALLANAPFESGQRSDVLSVRGRAQTEYGRLFTPNAPLDYLYPDALCDLHADFDTLVRGYFSLPMDRALVNGQKQYVGHLTMNDYIRNGIGGYYPDVTALRFLFREPIVDVRPEFVEGPRVETRAHDCVSSEVSVALDALYRGINANLDAAHDLMQGMYPHGALGLRRQRAITHHRGLRTAFPKLRVTEQIDIASELVDIAHAGLQKRNLGEEPLLAPLRAILDAQVTPAEQVLQGTKYHFNWAAICKHAHYARRRAPATLNASSTPAPRACA